MLFDFEQPTEVLLTRIAHLKTVLHQITNSSVLDSPDMRDDLINTTVDFLRSEFFDAIEGGFYRQDPSGFQFVPFHNAILAEYLLLADKVFYHGEPRFYGLALLDNLLNNFWRESKNTIAGDRHYSISETPFIISRNRLASVLNLDELNLLAALIGENNQTTNRHWTLCFRKPLKDAASDISMPQKQAQIIQSIIVDRLKQLQGKAYATMGDRVSLNTPDRCQMLMALIQALICYGVERFQESAQQISQLLTKELVSRQPDINDLTCLEEQLNIACTLIEYLQVSFDTVILSTVVQWLNGIDAALSFNFTPFGQSQLKMLVTVIDRLFQVSPDLLTFSLNNQWTKVKMDNHLAIHCVANNQRGIAIKQQLLAQYNVKQKIFELPN